MPKDIHAAIAGFFQAIVTQGVVIAGVGRLIHLDANAYAILGAEAAAVVYVAAHARFVQILDQAYILNYVVLKKRLPAIAVNATVIGSVNDII
jgi:hypothetical protein